MVHLLEFQQPPARGLSTKPQQGFDWGSGGQESADVRRRHQGICTSGHPAVDRSSRQRSCIKALRYDPFPAAGPIVLWRTKVDRAVPGKKARVRRPALAMVTFR
jgi:hypothetical protein